MPGKLKSFFRGSLLLPLLAGILTICSSFKIDTDLLTGTWTSSINYGEAKGTITAIFRKNNSGTISYSFSKSIYQFKYTLRGDSVIVFSSNAGTKNHNEYHYIKIINKDQLSLRPYPAKVIRESISLVDTDYKKQRAN